MKKLRILTISIMYPRKNVKMSGVFICRQAQYLAKYDIECDFLVPRPWAPWPLFYVPKWRNYGPGNPLFGPKELKAVAARHLRVPGMWFRRFSGRIIAKAIVKKAMEMHKQQPFDLVWGVSMTSACEAAVIIAKRLNLPVANLAIGSDVMTHTKELPVLWKKLGDTLEKTDLPIGVSQRICNRMLETSKCKRAPLCIYLGRDTEHFKPAENKESIRESFGISSGEIVGVYVGALEAMKGISELAAASQKLLAKYPNFHLICVGDGNARGELESLNDASESNDRVLLPGRVPPDEVAKYLQAADFLVFPSYSEGMPQSVLEAMNCGLPVVATKVGGIPEAVIDGQTGLLIDPKDVDQLKVAMERMITDDEFRLSAGKKSLDYVQEKFDPERNAKKMADAFRGSVNFVL